MEGEGSSRGRPSPPLQPLEVHKVTPRGPSAIVLYREEITGGSGCTCKQQMSAVAEGETSTTCVCGADIMFPSTFSRKMLTSWRAFPGSLAFSEVMFADHNTEENDAVTAFKVDSVTTGHFCICVHFMIPALSSVSQSKQIIPRRSIIAHVLPVKTKSCSCLKVYVLHV